jgi:hypothetical protein
VRGLLPDPARPDIWFGDHGDAVHRQGIKAHPAILLLAGDGILDPPAPEAGVEVVVAPRISTALAGFAGR